ncbi:ornithine decarboxylase 1-like [Mizuhopecten yessoensis]|uniref:ornithine decarboxylase n=1 Tax=Mizuhopecten yessoensis TaxID=6573 RepID=A0A210PQ12_MIZYE|nr:ornithine decarboxylase 1-like [Mizuhopecten yessoensis]XP_021378086.1 ornithine decarboxylase 1-like [Mizuhopecten yessoensis]OWF38568.1 Ornithine decarboxylase 1 [Mizuhopecten yessoensis]
MKQYIGKKCMVEMLTCERSTQSLVEEKIQTQNLEKKDDAFFVADLGDIYEKYNKWNKQLPRVRPFYAVKCNDDYAVLKLLVDLGLSFDCASKNEIQKILDLGVHPSRIIYANPCKQMSFIRHAAKNQVSLMTFDNEDELIKIKALYPDAQLVLRILPPTNFKVQCELGMKFGCHPNKARHLLEAAKRYNLTVMGVSFHVGSGCEEANAFAVAVEQARTVFDHGLDLGFDMKLLDIGGGFPGQESATITFEEITDVLNGALDRCFPEEEGVDIIAEPGRFFVASAFSLTVNIIAKRVVARDQHGENAEPMDYPTADEEPSIMYYVNDGVYGSFNCLLYDHATVTACVPNEVECELPYTSSVWGPTCDGLDCIHEEVKLPELQVGDWLYFSDMGAYTLAAASGFNGMPSPQRFYVCSVKKWRAIYQEASEAKCLPIKSVPQMKAGHQMYEAANFLGSSPAEGFIVGNLDI